MTRVQLFLVEYNGLSWTYNCCNDQNLYDIKFDDINNNINDFDNHNNVCMYLTEEEKEEQE